MFGSKDPPGPDTSGPTLQSSLANTVSYVRLAEAIGVKVDTLHRWVVAGRIIQPTYFGSEARWTEDQARQILAEGTQPPGTYPQVASRLARAAYPATRPSAPVRSHKKPKTKKPASKKPPPAKPSAKKRRAP